MSTIDPFTTEVITNALAMSVDEMAVTIVRTAHSALIREAMDFTPRSAMPKTRSWRRAA